MNLMKQIDKYLILCCSIIAAEAIACPAGQHEQCIVPNPFTGGCVQAICVPDVPGVCTDSELIIRNPTTATIGYTFDGQSKTIEPNRRTTWSKCVTAFNAYADVTFDYSFRPGVQSKTYSLEYCPKGLAYACTYRFALVDSETGIDLYKD